MFQVKQKSSTQGPTNDLKIILQPKQWEAIELLEKSPVLFYGGARGGGKSHLVRAWQFMRRFEYPGTKGLIIRKTYPELYENHVLKFFEEFPIMFNWYNKSEKIFYFPNGSTLTMSHLDNPSDVFSYFGREYEDIAVDESQQHLENTFKTLRASNRTINPNITPRMLLTGNPGDIGHQWLKRLFIKKDYRPEENPNDYAFLQAKVWDNPILTKNDPTYIPKLESLAPQLRKAYLDGSWDVFEGQFFQEWRDVLGDNTPYHVVNPFKIPDYWKRFVAVDWGYFPGWFVALWFAVAPNKRLYLYKELSFQRKPSRQAAQELVDYSGDDPVAYVVADPSMWIKAQGSTAPSLAEEFVDGGIPQTILQKGNNDREIGWGMIRKYLSKAPDGLPWLQVFKTCERVIETVPSLIHDVHKPEDVLKDVKIDHWGDALRYGCMTRPFASEGAIIGREGVSVEEVMSKTFEVDEEGRMPNIYADLIRQDLKGEEEMSDEDAIPDYGDR